MPLQAPTTYEVLEESPQEARAVCLSILNATRRHTNDADRFQWLYEANPHGNAVVWTVRNGASGEPVGFTAALPRKILVGGEERRCWVGSDFSMLPRGRTLGPAVKLRRSAREGVDAGRADFLYAHPNDRMAVIHGRVGHRPVGKMVRLAKPLRLGACIANAIGVPRLESAAGALLDPVRRLTDPLRWMRGPQGVRHEPNPVFDDRFDDLFLRTARNFHGVIGVRDSEYLAWRYSANPLEQTQSLLAEQEGRLEGYLLFAEQEDGACIRDLLPMTSADAARRLLHALVRRGYERGWRSVSMTLLQSNPIVHIATELGFRPRNETSMMYAYCPADRPWSAAVHDASQWLITAGDRDV